MPRGRQPFPRNKDGNIVRPDGSIVPDYYARKKARRQTIEDIEKSIDRQKLKSDVALGTIPDYNEMRESADTLTADKPDENVLRLRRNMRELSEKASLVVKGAAKFQPGENPAQIADLYVAEAKLLGIDPRHLKDMRSEAEKAQDACRMMLEEKSDAWGIFDDELRAVIHSCDLAVMQCDEYLDGILQRTQDEKRYDDWGLPLAAATAEVAPQGGEPGAGDPPAVGPAEAVEDDPAPAACVPDPVPDDGGEGAKGGGVRPPGV